MEISTLYENSYSAYAQGTKKNTSETILSLLQRDLGDYYGSGPRRACVVLTGAAT